MSCIQSLVPVGIAGAPAMIIYSSTSVVTTAPADTTAPLPIVMLGKTTTLAPIHTS